MPYFTYLTAHRRPMKITSSGHRRQQNIRGSSLWVSLNRQISLEIDSSGSVDDGLATPIGDRAWVSRNRSVSSWVDGFGYIGSVNTSRRR